MPSFPGLITGNCPGEQANITRKKEKSVRGRSNYSWRQKNHLGAGQTTHELRKITQGQVKVIHEVRKITHGRVKVTHEVRKIAQGRIKQSHGIKKNRSGAGQTTHEL
jgi:hypothetical protein